MVKATERCGYYDLEHDLLVMQVEAAVHTRDVGVKVVITMMVIVLVMEIQII